MSSEDDPYTPPAERRGVVRLLSNTLWAFASLGVFIGAVTYAYNLGTRSPDDIPSINPQHSVWKTPPEERGGREFAGSDMTAHNTRGDAAPLPAPGSIASAPIERPIVEDEEVASLQTPERSLVAVAEEAARDRDAGENRRIVDLDTLPPIDGSRAPSLEARPAFPPNIGTGSIADAAAPGASAAQPPQRPAPAPSQTLGATPGAAEGETASAPNGDVDAAEANAPAAAALAPAGQAAAQAPTVEQGVAPPSVEASPTQDQLASLEPQPQPQPQPSSPADDAQDEIAALAAEALQEFARDPSGPTLAARPNQRPGSGAAAAQARERGGLLGFSNEPGADLGPVAGGAPLSDDIAENGVDLGVLTLPPNQSIIVGTPPPPETVETAPFATTQDSGGAAQPTPAPRRPAPPPPQSTQPAPPPTTAQGGGAGFVVQLAALASEQAVRERWSAYQVREPQLLGPRRLVVEPVTVTNSVTGGESRLFRLRVTAADRVDARRLCKDLTERGFTCFVPPQ